MLSTPFLEISVPFQAPNIAREMLSDNLMALPYYLRDLGRLAEYAAAVREKGQDRVAQAGRSMLIFLQGAARLLPDGLDEDAQPRQPHREYEQAAPTFGLFAEAAVDDRLFAGLEEVCGYRVGGLTVAASLQRRRDTNRMQALSVAANLRPYERNHSTEFTVIGVGGSLAVAEPQALTTAAELRFRMFDMSYTGDPTGLAGIGTVRFPEMVGTLLNGQRIT